MGTKYKIIPDQSTMDRMVVHSKTAERLKMSRDEMKNVSHGIASLKVKVLSSSQVGVHSIVLSQNIINHLRIPLDSSFELVQRKDEIRIGPFIGFLLTQTDRYFKQYLPLLSDYLKHYGDIGGTILAFSLDHVNREKKTIHGYVFNPCTKEWDSGSYGYPHSFFIKSQMISPEWRQHFESIIGKGFYNNFSYDKWEMFNLLRSYGLQQHLPPTQLINHAYQIPPYLNKYKDLYIKPIRGSRGRSIARMKKEQTGIFFSFRDKESNQEIYFPQSSLFIKFMEKRIKPDTFLLQKTMKLISWKKRIVDFRLLMVRSIDGQWRDLGLIARCGPRGSVVSNISAGGIAEIGNYFLKKRFNFSDDEVVKLRQQMAQLGYQVAECLDRSGVHCGNMGVDIGLDQNRKLWILEIQHNNPDPTLALDARAERLYLEILRHQLLYLKGLAGFNNQSLPGREDIG